MRQANIFIRGEGDKWLKRNRNKLGKGEDMVDQAIDRAGIKPEKVLEIGCSNGWRLSALRDKYGCKVMGLDPSHAAGEEAKAKDIPVWEATATALPILSAQFDVVIYGFCLYLVDPADWFTIVKEGDRVLAPGGHLIIHDFAAHTAWGCVYEHCDGVVSYHVDFAGFWRANPLYRYVTGIAGGDDEMVTVLQKLPLDTIEVLP